jgi:hypothetical protein
MMLAGGESTRSSFVIYRCCRKNLIRGLRYIYGVIAASKDELRAFRKNFDFCDLIQIDKNEDTTRLR